MLSNVMILAVCNSGYESRTINESRLCMDILQAEQQCWMHPESDTRKCCWMHASSIAEPDVHFPWFTMRLPRCERVFECDREEGQSEIDFRSKGVIIFQHLYAYGLQLRSECNALKDHCEEAPSDLSCGCLAAACCSHFLTFPHGS